MKPRRIAVAYSAGRDSTALLHATLAAAAEAGVEVVALHVHHGLSASADAWLQHAQAQCARWAQRGWPVTFAAHRVDQRPPRGDSIEAWARQQRYAALRTMALTHAAPTVLLAHHQRDQAQTVVLQALRGAGLPGLSAMPRDVERDGIRWVRPWLDRSREEIERYLRRHRLRYVDDESNDAMAPARSRLDVAVWPALIAAFPQAEPALAASAGWAQQAQALLDEVAAGDLAQLADGDALRIDAWQELSAPRRINALRAWLRQARGAAAPSTLTLRLLDELSPARAARWPLPGGELRAYRGRLRFDPIPLSVSVLEPRERHLAIRRAGVYALPGWRGSLRVVGTREGGVPLAWLARLELRDRVGGEQFQAAAGGVPRSLKKQYQAAAVPAWARDGPLLYSGGQLVFVAGLGLDARVCGLPGQRLVRLAWEAEGTRPEHAG